MDSIRVNISYRPLRIGWAIDSGDMEAYRKAVQFSYSMWGGRFNPILVVDHKEEADRLVDLFRVDIIIPLSDSIAAREFPNLHSHLIDPFYHESLFIGSTNDQKKAQVLDIYNEIVHLQNTSEWKAIKEKGVRIYDWKADDPLADVFLLQFGRYPRIEESGIDYKKIFKEASGATEYLIDPSTTIPADSLDRPSIPYLSRHGLERHYSVTPGWDTPGFFVGDATNLDNLVCCWNLRAADIPIWFVDPNHLDRYTSIVPAWEKLIRDFVSNRPKFRRAVAIWSLQDISKDVLQPIVDSTLVRYSVSIDSWNGLNIRPPMMHFGEISTLGVIGRDTSKPRVSFMLNNKPFSGESWFHTQHLVASISFNGLYDDENHTLNPPYVPELNEFYGRTMHIEHSKFRIESERLGLIIDAADTDAFLYALPTAELIEKMLDMAGFLSKPSRAGLVTRQLITRLGGLQGARVFKIPGVRRLLKTYGPTSLFTMKSAVQLIGGRDPDCPTANFSDYGDLYIEPRRIGEKLSPMTVFSYLVAKGLFRIGSKLACPSCRMDSWTALDNLKQRVVCELCGNAYDATRQLVKGKWSFRRSGILGAEKNALGAVPVALTLQQLDTNLDGGFRNGIYSPSMDLEPKDGATRPNCEVDFIWAISRRYPGRTVIILGECKDQGPIDLEDFKNDVSNLLQVADAFPSKRFKTFVLLSRLSPFTPGELEYAKRLNSDYEQRAILLTHRELEPYQIFERTKLEYDIKEYGNSPEELAKVTADIYFME